MRSVLVLAMLATMVHAQPKEPPATPPEKIKTLKDFKVELLYSVPKDKEGSWVNLCHDPKGRLIVSDQYGGLFRVTPPALDANANTTKIERISVDLGEAQGLLWAFNSLYVVVNKGQKHDSGLYRVRDTDGDDVLDKVEVLKKIDGAGEHGPHAVMLTPDGTNLVVVCGNATKLVNAQKSRVPRLWGEDHLLPRMPDGNGFMAGVLGPGGAIYQVDPEGKTWEILAVGFRNEYDAAFNRQGDLFSYDADMEWDMNTPWYRPTRVNLVASGAEFGWRNGAGKWPAYYPDSLGSVVDIGPGSPTGVCFGYGTKFPAKYQDAFYICDWSYGKLYAVHMTADGSAYKGQTEEFVSGSPLPLTDVIVNPKDGALYFTIGGRKTKSGLYRVTYTGKDATTLVTKAPNPTPEHSLRLKLEAFHTKSPKAVETVWQHLGHADRYVRFAARVALEHQDPKLWQERALAEKDRAAALTALLGLVRASFYCPHHHPKAPRTDAALQGRILDALTAIPWEKLSDDQRLELIRIYHVFFNRTGKPDEEAKKKVLAQVHARFPANHRYLNAELVQLLVYLEAPKVVERTLKQIAEAPTQEEQLEYGRALRVLKTGWTLEQRKEYFTWLLRAANFKGGNSMRGFLTRIRTDAVATLTPEEKTTLKDVLNAKPDPKLFPVQPPRPVVKQWKMDDLAPLMEKGLSKGRDYERGRKLFGAANCFACHRFDNEGGSLGPDLTGIAGRFSARDLLESVLDPSKEVSDQYAAVSVTGTDGKVVTGRIVNLSGDNIIVMPNMLDPNGLVHIDRKKVESIETSKVSQMPTGTFDVLKEDEILDLMAYLLSRGDRKHAMFRKE